MHAILGMLEAQPMNGYDLARGFDASTGCAVWSAPRSQIYPMLRKMEDAGLVEAESQIRGTRLERRVYSVTDAGLAELREWVGTPQDTTVKRDAILLQALFLDLVEPEVAVEVLEHIIAEQTELVAGWERQADQVREMRTPVLRARLKHREAAEHERIAELKAHVHMGGAALARARVEWAEQGLALLREYQPVKKKKAAKPRPAARSRRSA
ncbi:PadR family transcriptional regulator [Kribbella kalugense]|nr:PadR family transcriptional regulator [Kribbella kalugense]